jgi:hypothetical protein
MQQEEKKGLFRVDLPIFHHQLGRGRHMGHHFDSYRTSNRKYPLLTAVFFQNFDLFGDFIDV